VPASESGLPPLATDEAFQLLKLGFDLSDAVGGHRIVVRLDSLQTNLDRVAPPADRTLGKTACEDLYLKPSFWTTQQSAVSCVYLLHPEGE
jgi:hypothetical protein